MRNVFIVMIFLFLSGKLSANIVEISNKYVRIGADYGTGRITMSTVEGEPDNPAGSNKVLLFSKIPPASFTTVSVDGVLYVYGSDDMDHGFIKRPAVSGNKIVSEWNDRGIDTVQELSIAEGTSGLPDTLNISYRFINRSGRPSVIEARVVLDPVLGEEEPGSFVIPGQGVISRETLYNGFSIPSYWYAFDNYDNPTVRVQGIIENATKPSMIIFASWERFFDSKWDFPVDSSRDFKRQGTGRNDSAVALYYGPLNIDKSQTNEINVKYGVYPAAQATEKGLTLSLSLPGKTGAQPFTVTADLLNSGKTSFDRIVMEIFFPRNFMLTQGQTNVIEFPRLNVNESRKAEWELIGTEQALPGDYEVDADAAGWINEEKTEVSSKKTFSFFRALPLTTAVATNAVATNASPISPVMTNTTAVTTNAVPALTGSEKLLLQEISSLDRLIESVDLKYGILQGIYKSEYTTNGTFLDDIDNEIRQYEEKLSDEEKSLSNELSIFQE